MRADSTWLSRLRALARFEDRQGQSSHIERNRALTRSFCTHREVDKMSECEPTFFSL